MRYRRLSGFIVGAVMVLCGGGCTESVSLKVESEVPVALVQKIPLGVTVYYPPAFSDYRYTEDSDERPQWDIASGDAQVAMFDRVLDSTFTEVTHLGTEPGPGVVSGDLGIVPSITDMQLATPAETGFGYYEAWFRYRIALTDRDGMQHEPWDIAAYGKAPKKRFTMQTEGLSQAIAYALRDIGAKLATGFRQQPAVVRALEGAP
jgi:hypothetical protein